MAGRWRRLAMVPWQVWNYARMEPITWFEDGRLAACRYPRDAGMLQTLADAGVRVVVNLHEQGHAAGRLEALGMREVHLPVADFTAPTPVQLETGVGVVRAALDAGERVVAVHCGGGLGRTGTLVACFFVARHRLGADEAIAEVRRHRPGSVETPEQVEAVREFARRAAKAPTDDK
jgi:atypical dual specificity phosphatase